MIFILDNYDSFTYNLVQMVAASGVAVRVLRNDQIGASELGTLSPAGIILSPGPGRPEAAGRMPEILATFAGRLPILGVCLGHQMIALHFGGRIVPASRLIHGQTSFVHHDGQGLFRDLPNPFAAGRYHSLAVDPHSVPPCLEITAWSDDGEIMGLRHKSWPIEGVQFHPESVLTPQGSTMIAAFLSLVAEWKERSSGRPAFRSAGASVHVGHYVA